MFGSLIRVVLMCVLSQWHVFNRGVNHKFHNDTIYQLI